MLGMPVGEPPTSSFGIRLSDMLYQGTPAPPRNSAQTLHRYAARQPMLMSVSIVVVPWRSERQAARWNGQAPQNTTGVASAKHSHCQYVNCRGGIIEMSTTGVARARENQNRRRRSATSASPAISALLRSSSDALTGASGAFGGSGGSAS
jgi:hypothetical protein